MGKMLRLQLGHSGAHSRARTAIGFSLWTEGDVGMFGFPSVASQGRVRARAVTVGVAVMATLLPLVGVAPTAQAAAVVSLTFDDSNADQMTAATALQSS